MANTFILETPQQQTCPWTTPDSFGPLTNADVMAVGAVPTFPPPALLPVSPYAVERTMPWPVPETAVGYVAQQDVSAGARFWF